MRSPLRPPTSKKLCCQRSRLRSDKSARIEDITLNAGRDYRERHHFRRDRGNSRDFQNRCCHDDRSAANQQPSDQRTKLSLFALTTSTVGRDNGRPIGPAPTTGLNFGGQRGRSNLVQVDGADNTDNSVNASRSTVSQEAVQEFQVVTNSFAPEFGRSAGGVVNVVTKSGTNDLHGNMFGFLRHRSFQARNAFAPIEDPPFTRAQYGFTLGGPLDKIARSSSSLSNNDDATSRASSPAMWRRGLTGSATIPVIPGSQSDCAHFQQHHSGAGCVHQYAGGDGYC